MKKKEKEKKEKEEEKKRLLTLLDSAPPLAGPLSQLLGIGLLDAGTLLKAADQVSTQSVPILHPLHSLPIVASLGHIREGWLYQGEAPSHTGDDS
jgi:hypothetical protein